MTIPVSEQGYAKSSSSWWEDDAGETAPELKWPKNIEVYDQMRRTDAQVGSVLRAVTLPIRRTQWRLDPNGARPEVVALVAEDLGLPVLGSPPSTASRTRGRFSWDEHLRLALLMLPFGHSFFEQVYRIDDAGQARLRKLGWRPPRTISKVSVAADGGLISIEQYASSKNHTMPVEHLVAYVNDREGGNWLGASLLRPAYKFWILKDRLLRVQAQTADRNGMGVPVYTGADYSNSTLPAEESQALAKAELDTGKKLAQGLRSGQTAGVALPHGANLEMKGVTGSLPDTSTPIKYYDEQIARAVLAHFLNLGTETGSWALGSTFADFFTQSLQTVAMTIADVTNQHVIEDLVDLNWGPDEPAPRLVFDEIGSRHAATAEAIKILVDAGVIKADEALETFLRATYGLPGADPSTTTREAPSASPAKTEDT